MMGDLIARVGGRPQIRRNRGGFTIRKRQAFLDALALTCNINRSAQVANVSRSTVHRTRSLDPAFAAQWREALAMGYDRLEALALEHGGAGQPLEPDPARAEAGEIAPMPFDFDKAMKLLAFHRAEREGRPRRTASGTRKLATREETNAALMKALAAAKRRIEKARLRDG